MNKIRIAPLLFAAILLFSGSDAAAGVEALSTGADTFAAKCASCHGKDGAGKTAIGKKMALRDLGSAAVQKQTDQQLLSITSKGKKKMPAYEKKLSAGQLKELVRHMRSLAKKR